MSLTWDEQTLSPDAWSDTAPPRWRPEPMTRVYLVGGRVAHYREHAACIRRRDYDDWHGTGSQAEYDRAAVKPLCPACFAWRWRAFPDGRLGTGHGTELA